MKIFALWVKSATNTTRATIATRTGPEWDQYWQLDPEKYGSNFKSVISKHMLLIKFMSTFCETALR